MRREKGKPALWRQIEDELASEIVDKQLEPGLRMPTEPELMARFGVGRHTLRQAMAGLEAKGLIRIEQGRGTFVTDSVIHYNISARTRFSQNVIGQGKEPSIRILGIEQCDSLPGRQFADVFEGPLYHVRNLSYADDIVICLCDAYFPKALFPNLDQVHDDTKTTTELFRIYGISDYVRDVTRIRSRLPTGEEARKLELAKSQPVLVLQKLDTDLEGRAISFSEAVWPADRVDFIVDTRAVGSGAADQSDHAMLSKSRAAE